MSKKTLSSLIMVGFCFNSLPVYAGKNFYLGEQKQRWRTQTKFSKKQETKFPGRSNISGPMDPRVLLAGLTSLSLLRAGKAAPTGHKRKASCDKEKYSQEELKRYFTSSGATHACIFSVPRITMLSSGEIEADYGPMTLSLHSFRSQIESRESNFFASSVTSGGACAIYQTQSRGTSLFELGDRNEDRFLEEVSKKATEKKLLDFFNSRSKQHVVLPSQGTFGFVKFLPNIEGDQDRGIFKASLGDSRLSFSKYSNKGISGPHLVAFYDQGKTRFALRNGDDYIELRTESGNQLDQLGNEATYFLKSLFEGTVIRNYFPEEIAKTSTTEFFLPSVSSAPEPDLSIISLGRIGTSMLPPIQEQLPGAGSSDYSFKDIGIGAAAVGVGVVVGGAVWLATKCCKKHHLQAEHTEMQNLANSSPEPR